MKYNFPALIIKEDDGFVVTFPDLEDTFSQGDTREEVLENAEDVLNLMLCNREEKNIPIPDASSIEKIEVPPNAKLAWFTADTLEYRKKNEVLGAIKTEKMVAYNEMQKLRKQTAAYELKDCEAERDNAVSEKFGEFMKV